MSTWEIVAGILLLICCALTIVICLCQDSKAQDSMTSAITGASTDSFYGKNEGRTREAKLIKITRNLTIVFFVLTLVVNIVPMFIN
ncbi:MAG: preprotein translocase subunit SecG [Oscillospiraceae bacterium]|nr:preprotein translocase subunit SecG [Oscillospiraceae bacterium]